MLLLLHSAVGKNFGQKVIEIIYFFNNLYCNVIFWLQAAFKVGKSKSGIFHPITAPKPAVNVAEFMQIIFNMLIIV